MPDSKANDVGSSARKCLWTDGLVFNLSTLTTDGDKTHLKWLLAKLKGLAMLLNTWSGLFTKMMLNSLVFFMLF